ncbi:DNA replication protein, variant 2 [Entomophthora muscae]|uniref:DNA replication protein, variant 2 n=1 Tax=Entomophthora muscae TaxID=34485 RepID=A0ACC2SMS7_9FUNG|nr:DNA replication protein, variant 2 [Entomophthora muscae]
MPSVQNGLRACSDNVNINSLNPHYFKLGKKLAHSEGPRGNETDAAMVEFLAETYQNRLGLVLDKATTHRHLSAEAYSFLATLDASEKHCKNI